MTEEQLREEIRKLAELFYNLPRDEFLQVMRGQKPERLK